MECCKSSAQPLVGKLKILCGHWCSSNCWCNWNEDWQTLVTTRFQFFDPSNWQESNPGACLPCKVCISSLGWENIHSNELIWLNMITQTIQDCGLPINHKEPGVAQSLLDKCNENYLMVDSLHQSSNTGDRTIYNSRLRLRDCASIFEEANAMRAGDIGQVLLMWERWVVMAHDLKGLSHYTIHLPRLMLILENDIPSKISKAMKQSLLIPTCGRDGHWVAQDFYLGIQD